MLFFSVVIRVSATGASVEPDSSAAREIHEITFTGNDAFSPSALKDVIGSRETPGGFSQFVYRTLGEKFGSRPEFFFTDKLESDVELLKNFYRDHGYYEAGVSSSYNFLEGDEEADIAFAIHENALSLVDTVRYEGLAALPEQVSAEIYKAPILQKGMPYEAPKGGLEVGRILNILMNNGYPSATFDVEHSGSYHHKSQHTFDLKYVFRTGALHHFGDITIHVDPPREDLVDALTLRQLDFEPGDIYSRSKKISSESNLNRLGIFESARIDHAPPSEAPPVDSIPIEIFARPRPLNEVTPEVIVSDENNAFNLGLGVGYTNRNFFGDGRSFSAHLRARTQTIEEFFKGARLRDTSFIGTTSLDLQILQPYLFTRTLSGSWTTTIQFEKFTQYINSIFRNRVGVSNRFATFTTGYVDWSLERVSTEFISPTANVDEIIQKQNLDKQPQFNSIITFTLQRDKTNDVFSPTEGFFHSISVEESGILPKLFKGLAGGLPFTQYYKLLLSGRWYEDLGRSHFNILAMKLKTGFQEKYGESKYLPVFIPLNRRFFSGGSGSVRGWRARELGAMSDDLLPYGGNFMVEGSAEMRVNHFRGFGKLAFIRMDAIWMVYFVDFGTVWSEAKDFQMRDIGIAAGVGFRYDTFFGPFRFDFGFKVYDPGEQPGREWMFAKKFFSETLSSGVLHFGIGHAF